MKSEKVRVKKQNLPELRPRRFLEASPRLELGVRILQTLALPLGYDAISYRVMTIRLCGAGDGIRTRDFHLGKVTLYH